jgi:hypothetical protein
MIMAALSKVSLIEESAGKNVDRVWPAPVLTIPDGSGTLSNAHAICQFLCPASLQED